MNRIHKVSTLAGILACSVAPVFAENGPITLGHISPQTGPYSHFGPHFDGAIDFTLDIINENPPLGRPIEAIHADFGTLGEGPVARRLVDSDNVDILFNLAHGYESYRDWIIGYVAENGRPMMPSVHAGSQKSAYGGTEIEPLFRGSPMDTAQATAVVLYAKELGANSVVIIASEDAGMQMSQDAAIEAAELLGMEVLGEIDIQTQQTSYRSEAARANSLKPDAMLVFAQAEEGGILVKNSAELGLSATFIGEPNWLADEFPRTATMGAIDRQNGVYIVGYSHADGEAWDYFSEKWEGSSYADLSPAGDSYTMQMYDLLNVTALAIEAAGSTNAQDWANTVRDVSMAPGQKVYNYTDAITALRAGKEIDYEGVTGTYDYNDTGVVSGQFASFSWNSPTEWDLVTLLDGPSVLELNSQLTIDP